MGGWKDERYAKCFHQCQCPPKWIANYHTEKGTGYFIEDTEIGGCPVKYITAQSIEWLQLCHRLNAAKEVTGAGLYGSDLSKYPSRTLDVLVTIEKEGRLVDWEDIQARKMDPDR